MNHYQRLKVAQDAPPEVIRAAYRALATKMHPDRQGPDTSPQDALHSEMAALNAAYETLIDPKLRSDYDATLAPSAATQVGDAGDSGWFARQAVGAAAGPGQEPTMGSQTKVDMDWLTPGTAQADKGWWPPNRQTVLVGGGAATLLAITLSWSLWSAFSQRQVEDALTRQYRSVPPTQVADADAPSGSGPAAAVRKPSVDELARMSDEELLKVLPTLDEDTRSRAPHASSFVGMAHHPLDGGPLRLRTDRDLVDPLAPEPARH